MFEQILTLSTIHTPGPNPSFDGLNCLEHEHGWFVFVQEDGDMPDWIKPIMKFAVEHRCVGVLFDADSDEDVQFQTFDVEW